MYNMHKKETKHECNCEGHDAKHNCECKEKEQNQKCNCEEKNVKVEELIADLKRVQAEFENYQKRTEREFISRDERNRANILGQTLSVLDALNEGIKHEPKNEGLVKVKEVFVKFLNSNGVKEMTKTVGDQFDHEEMDCMMQGNDNNKKDGEILEILQKGYFMNDKVLRFAKVKVNKICNNKEEKKFTGTKVEEE